MCIVMLMRQEARSSPSWRQAAAYFKYISDHESHVVGECPKDVRQGQKVEKIDWHYYHQHLEDACPIQRKPRRYTAQ